ncbi:MAG: hypothetical protein Q4D37_10015 [Oscillospiraceae bacterium]|nr:hypothetical protein [Oscillospiraceae bacterium]
MKMQIKATHAITCAELRHFAKLLGTIQERYPDLELEFQAEVLSRSVNHDFIDLHNLTPEQRKEIAGWLND